MDTSKGFTLIELLVVMGVLAIMGGVILSIFFSVLRGTNKTNQLIIVRQNGNYAISQMSKIIRNAKRLEYPASCTPSVSTPYITLIGQNDEQIILEHYPISNILRARSIASTVNLTSNTQVRATNLQFTCTQAPNSNTFLIYISFIVSQSSTNPGSENSASLPFSTSIAFRNYQ